MERDEVALKFALVIAAKVDIGYEMAIKEGYRAADLFSAAAVPTPAPVPPPAPTPAPEAKRPDWVRITRSPKDGWRVTTGKVYPVARWSEDSPLVTADDGSTVFLSRPDGKDTDSMGYPAWEPAPCPPPVAGRGETLPDTVRELLLDIEHAAKWANQPQGPAVEYVRGRLKELAARAHDILASRPVRP